MTADWSKLDVQMRRYSPRLRDDLRIDSAASNHLATSISAECAALPPERSPRFERRTSSDWTHAWRSSSPFKVFMDLVASSPTHPSVVRAQVITQNYLCFVYLGDSCFKVLQKNTPSGSTVRRCCRFLTDNPIRALRNALAHANWRYNEDVSGLTFGRARAATRMSHSAISRSVSLSLFLAGACALRFLCRFLPCNERGLNMRWSERRPVLCPRGE